MEKILRYWRIVSVVILLGLLITGLIGFDSVLVGVMVILILSGMLDNIKIMLDKYNIVR